MEREVVRSSTIRAIGYDSSTRVLEIQFYQGGTYRYFEVPEFVHRALMLAQSKGEYFNRCIVDRYRFEELHG